MNTQVHQALGELQDALQEIHEISQQLELTKASTEEAARMAARSAKGSAEYQELLKKQVQESLTKLEQMAQQLVQSVSETGQRLDQIAHQRANELSQEVTHEVGKVQQDIHAVTEPYQELSEETQKLVDYLRSKEYLDLFENLQKNLSEKIEETDTNIATTQKRQTIFFSLTTVLLIAILIAQFL